MVALCVIKLLFLPSVSSPFSYHSTPHFSKTSLHANSCIRSTSRETEQTQRERKRERGKKGEGNGKKKIDMGEEEEGRQEDRGRNRENAYFINNTCSFCYLKDPLFR